MHAGRVRKQVTQRYRARRPAESTPGIAVLVSLWAVDHPHILEIRQIFLNWISEREFSLFRQNHHPDGSERFRHGGDAEKWVGAPGALGLEVLIPDGFDTGH